LLVPASSRFTCSGEYALMHNHLLRSTNQLTLLPGMPTKTIISHLRSESSTRTETPFTTFTDVRLAVRRLLGTWKGGLYPVALERDFSQ
jgi:hypothetical protein